MADPVPTYVTCTTSCTITIVHDLALPPLQLDAAEGALIAGAILAIWAIGFGFRALVKTLNIGGNTQPDEST